MFFFFGARFIEGKIDSVVALILRIFGLIRCVVGLQFVYSVIIENCDNPNFSSIDGIID